LIHFYKRSENAGQVEEETNEEAKEKEAKDEGEVQIRRPLS
jgi:hypothetical protein